MHGATLTLCLAVAAGVVLVVAGRRIGVPSIVLLLLGGVLLGPEVLGWIEPQSLGGGLEIVISLTVAVILFEGGLTLDIDGYRRAAIVIRRLLTVGSLVSWLGVAATVVLLFDLDVGMALMAGSLVIVTGPTVVSPLLRRLRVKERLHHVLYWEGVLIDAVGVFVAVLCYEWLTPDQTHPLLGPIGRFGLRILVGVGLGVCAGLVVATVLKRNWIPKEHVNIFVLASALLTFGVAHVQLTESGILAVVIAGLVVGFLSPPQLKYVKRFKLQLTELGIGMVFILLAAKLDLSRFHGWRLVVLLAVVMLVLRPLAIGLSTWGQRFDWREKVFLSWIAPRGIVAAAMASLFSLRLQELGRPEAIHLETFTYAVIVATVTLQGLSAPWLAKVLKVHEPDRRTWVLLGNNILVEALGRAMRRAGVKVVELSDPHLRAEEIDSEDPRFADVQAMLCADITMLQNVFAVFRWAPGLGDADIFRWATFEPADAETQVADPPAGRAVWAGTVTAAAVVQGLLDGSHSIDVIELGKQEEHGRFGRGFLPLFWVKRGRAEIVVDWGGQVEQSGDVAVVLRRRITGLADLVAHVEVVHEPEPGFESVVRGLANSAKRLYPDLDLEAEVGGIIEREQTMPSAVGAGVAIPHGYCHGLDRSRCFLAVVPEAVDGMTTPDEAPVRLVFLLLSPKGKAGEHLESLAALASLGQEPELIALLSRQRVPERIARLVKERA